MQSTQVLPTHYIKGGSLDLTKNQGLLLILNIAGLVLLVLAGWLFYQALFRLRPYDTFRSFRMISINSATELVVTLAVLLLLTAFHIILHEAVHGIFFWLFTRSRPIFAFRWVYAYAAAPDWYLPRNQFLITTLAPLVLISLAGLILFRIAPSGWLLAVWYVITMNAAGAVGDMLAAVWILRHPTSTLVQDRGDAITLYLAGA